MENIDFVKIGIYFIALLIAIIGHEIMHGLVALKYGDNTAKLEGRLTINPIPHIDLFGSIIIPISLIVMNAPIMFGYAKPVPVDTNVVQNNGGYKACMYVSLAGVFYNFALALLCIIIIKLGFYYSFISKNDLMLGLLLALFSINIVLGTFNLIPIPPLDGSKALAYLGLIFNKPLFAKLYNNLESYGMIIIILLILIPFTREMLGSLINAIAILFFKI